MLATTSAQRVAGWEQVPALAETLPGFDMVGWFAVVAPTGTPAAVIERVNRDVNALLADKEVAERIAAHRPDRRRQHGRRSRWAPSCAARAHALGGDHQGDRRAAGVNASVRP